MTCTLGPGQKASIAWCLVHVAIVAGLVWDSTGIRPVCPLSGTVPVTRGASKTPAVAAVKDEKGKAARTFGGSTVTVCAGANFVNARCRGLMAIQRTLHPDGDEFDYSIDMDDGDVGYLYDENIPEYPLLFGNVITAAVQLADKSPHMAHRYEGDLRRWNQIPDGKTISQHFDFETKDPYAG